MSLDRIYLARFMTASKRQHALDLCERGREGKVLSLESFWDHNSVTKILEEYPEVKILLDSGAYTLENQKVKNYQQYLDAYIDYILKYKDRWLEYVCLDDVHDACISWKNQKYMESRGVNPLPVYHHGEDWKWFERYANEYSYMGVGGVARGGAGEGNRILFDKIFKYIRERGLSVKVHAFGITSYRYMMRYPWFSVDSTTWLKYANFGRVMIPRWDARKQQFNYLCTNFVVSVSDISLHKQDTDHSHYTLLYSPKIVGRINKYFEMIGIDSEKLKTEQAERLRANVYYYERLQKEPALHTPPKPRDDGALF